MQKPIHRIKEAKVALGVGTTKIYGLITEGRLKTSKIGRATVITNLEEFVAELKSGAN